MTGSQAGEVLGLSTGGSEPLPSALQPVAGLHPQSSRTPLGAVVLAASGMPMGSGLCPSPLYSGHVQIPWWDETCFRISSQSRKERARDVRGSAVRPFLCLSQWVAVHVPWATWTLFPLVAEATDLARWSTTSKIRKPRPDILPWLLSAWVALAGQKCLTPGRV